MRYILSIIAVLVLSTTVLAQETTYSKEADKLVITEQKITKVDYQQIDNAIAMAQAEKAKYEAVVVDIQKTIDGLTAVKNKAIELGVEEKKIEPEVKPEEPIEEPIKPEPGE